MAEKGLNKITVVPLFKNTSLSAGDAATSDKIDLREIAQNGVFSLAHKIAAGTSGTVGTTVFTYKGSALFDGTYVTPSAAVPIGTAGSNGTGGTANISDFYPEAMAFMQIVATQTGAGTAGANTKIESAELIVQ